jgi:hypothetical protein
MQVATNPDRPFKVELECTNKIWKRVILAAWVVILGSFIIGAVLGGGNSQATFGGIMFYLIPGIGGLIVGKIGAWYSNR